MAEHNYGGPEVKMQQLKMRLRVICNAIIDQSIHMANMSEKEALDLMRKKASRRKAKRSANGNARGSLRRSFPLISSA